MESQDSRRKAALVHAEVLVGRFAGESALWWLLSIPLVVCVLLLSGSRAAILPVLGTVLAGGLPAWFAGRAVAQGIRANVTDTPGLYAFLQTYSRVPGGEALAARLRSLLPWSSDQAVYAPALRFGFSVEECRKFGRWWLSNQWSPFAGCAWSVVAVIWLGVVAGLLIHFPHELKIAAFVVPIGVLLTSIVFHWHVREAPLIESALGVPIERVMGEAGYRKVIGQIYRMR